ncbi:GMC family oxidoreductase N-terminal domain-containing protein [Chryseobacterium indologenes]|uniref:GMC family oxidoreductase N-terminal domain-containing protein n=1 Tax=Chryseobacterium indologenes TaxID=253 RepID=UPI001024740F|nr:GMC oxidoreductase [Chryseobacterium indologenes]TLX26093.1 GMC family oxidoreductase [Chryseobacterium indologenes]VFA43670.1 Cholesterol oxidase precursor [Chryseobacterium indologenes]
MDRKGFIKTSVLALSGFYFLYSDVLKAVQPRIAKQEKTIEAPIIIIGSGYGGAVSALRLCEAGKKVILLEMGLHWEKSGIPYSNLLKPGKSSAWLKKKTIAPFMNIFSLTPFTGTLDRLEFENINIWVGRGVGGGSLVNGGMAVTPKESYFKEIFPDLDSGKFYSHYFPLVREELKVNVIDEQFVKDCPYYKFTRVGEAEAHKAGFRTIRVPNVYDFKYMEKEFRNEVPRSALNTEVIYGNNYGKNSLDKTYLKKALATGNLEILDLHRVEHIQLNDDKSYSVSTEQIDTSGNILASKTFNCKKLILSAGTMGTLQLLLKSNAIHTFPINEKVGKSWGNNGNFMTGRNWVHPLSGGTGSKQSTIPVGGIDNWDDSEHPFFTEIAPLPMGMDVATALYLLINRVDKKGEVTFDKAKQALQLDWNQNHTVKMRENAKYFVRKMNKANGGTRSHFLFNNGFGADICYHPLGGCVLGEATDQYGKLKGHENLYVLDGSLIPGTIGVNPFVTITAIAEYCIENLIQHNEFA